MTYLKGKFTDPNSLKGTFSSPVARGYSAYDIAKLCGFEGTEQEWLESLKGDTGATGDMSSALTIMDGRLCCRYRKEQD